MPECPSEIRATSSAGRTGESSRTRFEGDRGSRGGAFAFELTRELSNHQDTSSLRRGRQVPGRGRIGRLAEGVSLGAGRRGVRNPHGLLLRRCGPTHVRLRGAGAPDGSPFQRRPQGRPRDDDAHAGGGQRGQPPAKTLPLLRQDERQVPRKSKIGTRRRPFETDPLTDRHLPVAPTLLPASLNRSSSSGEPGRMLP